MKHKRRLKDIYQRNIYKKTELFQKILLSLYRFVRGFLLKLLIQNFFFSILSTNSFKSSITNFCTVSGRSRGIYRSFKISRIVFKQLSEKGLFFGLQKLSW